MIALVTDVHYRMTPALIRALGRQGVVVYTCEKEGETSLPGARSKYAKKHFTLPREGYEDALLALLGELEQPVLFPMGAATLQAVAARREEFSAAAQLCVGSPASLALLNNKKELHELAKKLEIPIPRATHRCPCVVKPVCGEKFGLSAAQRYTVCRTEQERDNAIAHFKEITGEEPVVQEYLPGGGCGCSVIACEGKIVAWLGHRRLREYPISGGPSSCCVAVEDERLKGWAEKLVAATRHSGPAMFEFKEDGKGNPRLLECNPRIWGSFPLTDVACSTMTSAWLAAAQGKAAPANRYRTGKKMIFFPSDLTAGVHYLKNGAPKKFFAAWGDLLNPTVSDGLFCWSDPAPAFAYYAALLRRGGKR